MSIDLLWVSLFILAILGILANVASLAQGIRLRGQVRRGMRAMFGAYLPRVALLLPVRGVDPGFDENVRAILLQAYPSWRLVVIADEESDPAVGRIRALGREFPSVSIDVVRADPQGLGGKVNALRTALAHLAPSDEVVAFADADIRPPRDWLRQLVQPLADSSVGVSTGFRWYVPPAPTFWSLVRAEWNAVSANVLFDPRRAFAWGGSCAVRRDHLGGLRLDERWRDVLSDDLVLTQAVREAGLTIAYAPTALVPTFEGATRGTCVEWCLRQMTMATLYLPIVRWYATAAFAVFNVSVILGLASLAMAAVWGPAYLVPSFLFLLPLPSGIAKAWLRRTALLAAAPSVAESWRTPAWRTAIAALAVPWLMAWGLVRTRRPATVRWRGRVYDVRDRRHVRLVDAGRTRDS